MLPPFSVGFVGVGEEPEMSDVYIFHFGHALIRYFNYYLNRKISVKREVLSLQTRPPSECEHRRRRQLVDYFVLKSRPVFEPFVIVHT